MDLSQSIIFDTRQMMGTMGLYGNEGSNNNNNEQQNQYLNV